MEIKKTKCEGASLAKIKSHQKAMLQKGFEPPVHVHIAWWAHMHRFLSVRLSVCPSVTG